MNPIPLSKKTPDGTLLVAGTCIGAGMLGLPLQTAAMGFDAAVMFMTLIWLIMGVSASYMLEASLWFKPATNLQTMVRETLGGQAAKFVNFIYLAFLFALLAAYFSGGQALINKLLLEKIGISINKSIVHFGFVALIGLILSRGIAYLAWINKGLMVGLFVTYLIILNCTKPHALVFESQNSIKYCWFALPLMVTSFGFHLFIPSLKNFLNGEIKPLLKAIWLGSFIPLIMYLIWEYIILASIPTWRSGGLIEMMLSNQDASEQIVQAISTHNVKLSLGVAYFSLFALLTSLLGVAVGLLDYIHESMNLNYNLNHKTLSLLLCLLIPSVFSYCYPNGFLLALNYAGILAAILLIVLPALMVYRGRYSLNKKGFRVWGGKILNLSVLGFGVLIIIIESLVKLKVLPLPIL